MVVEPGDDTRRELVSVTPTTQLLDAFARYGTIANVAQLPVIENEKGKRLLVSGSCAALHPPAV